VLESVARTVKRNVPPAVGVPLRAPVPALSVRPKACEGELMAPVALEAGGRFAIREGGRTVGAGTVTEIIE